MGEVARHAGEHRASIGTAQPVVPFGTSTLPLTAVC
jgi:hypothetical protein